MLADYVRHPIRYRRCPHLERRCVHGDEIIATGYRRSRCLRCDRFLPELPDLCSITGTAHPGREPVESGPVDESIGEQRCAACGRLVGHFHAPECILGELPTVRYKDAQPGRSEP